MCWLLCAAFVLIVVARCYVCNVVMVVFDEITALLMHAACFTQQHPTVRIHPSSVSPSNIQLYAYTHQLFRQLTPNNTQAPAYFTGSEVRYRDPDLPLVQFAIAFEGASWTDADAIPLQVLQTMIGAWDKHAGAGMFLSLGVVVFRCVFLLRFFLCV